MDRIVCIVVCSLCIVSTVESQGLNRPLIPAPDNVRVDQNSVSHTSVWLTWDLVAKADSYTVTLRPISLTASGIGSGIREKFTIIRGLLPNTDYEFTIRAVKGDNVGVPAVITQRTALPAARNLQINSTTITATSMTVSWSAIQDVEYYKVAVDPPIGVIGTGSRTYTTSITLRGMSANTLYNIIIIPFNYVGDGARATVSHYTKMRPPTRLVVNLATVTSSTIGFQWQQVDGTHGYQLRVSPSVPGLDLNQLILETEFVLRRLSPDVLYLIQVAAVNVAGASDYATVSQKTLSMCFAQANQFEEQTFSVTCPAGCARFRNDIYGTRIYTLDSNICSAAIHDGRIDNDIGGTVMVRRARGITDFVGTPSNGIISKDYGSYHAAFIFALQPPQNVRVRVGSIGSESFIVEWNVVRGADAYRVRTSPLTFGSEGNIRETHVRLTGLLPNVTYTIQVEAVNERETSAEAAVTQRTALPRTTLVTVQPNSVTRDSFILSWSPVPGALRYRVSAMLNDNLVFTTTTPDLEMQVTNLTSGSVYNVTVQPVNHVGIGQPTSLVQFTALSIPSSPRVISVHSDSIEFMWAPVYGADYYTVSYAKNALDPCCMVNRTVIENRIVLSNLSVNQLYIIQVTASNRYLTSRRSLLHQVTALPKPENLRIDTSHLTHNCTSLSWDEVNGARSYLISMSTASAQRNTTTHRRHITWQSLTPRTLYSVRVAGRDMHNVVGDFAFLEFTTRVEPPSNLRVVADSNNNNQVQVTWDEVPGALFYNVTCSPPGGVIGTGVNTLRNVILSGLSGQIIYTVTVAATVDSSVGMPSSANFTVGMAPPSVVAIHNVTNSSMVVQWNNEDILVTALQYYIAGSSDLRSLEDLANSNKVVVTGLVSNTHYWVQVSYDRRLTQLDNSQQNRLPLKTKIRTKSNSADTDTNEVVLIWHGVQDATSYTVASQPNYNIEGLGYTTTAKTILTGLQNGRSYLVSVTAESADLASFPSVLNITGSGPVIAPVAPVVPTRPYYDETEYGSAPQPNENPFNNNYNNIDDNDGRIQNVPEEKNNLTWISIVVVVGVLFIMFVFLITVAICAGKNRKPLLRNGGCCWCFHCASGVKSCSCRGCCCDDDEYDGPYY